MPLYEIEQYELHTMRYRIEAQNEAEAIALMLDGGGEPLDDTCEFIEIATDFGMPSNENRELTTSLSNLGVTVGEAVMPLFKRNLAASF